MTAGYRQVPLAISQPPRRNPILWIARQCTAVVFALMIVLLIVVSGAMIVEFMRTDLPRSLTGALTQLGSPW